MGGDAQRHLILIVVALVVRTQANKQRQVVILELACLELGCLGVDVELYTLILSYVEVTLLVYGT